uniref:Protein tweety homolog n=1 Tax=Eptatretus burgeri TaxID=7764 RepID=A0A8C4RBA9_EPTBU
MAAGPHDWWVRWLHGFPHLDFHFRPVSSTFRLWDPAYQQSLLFLAGAVGVGLTLNLACLSLHFLCRCCRRSVSRAEPHHKGAHPRCATTWLLVAALICSSWELIDMRSSVAVGVGFYGSGETEDGLQRASEGLIGADTTIRDIHNLVMGWNGVHGVCTILSTDANQHDDMNLDRSALIPPPSPHRHPLPTEELEYYIHCDYQSSSPFQQVSENILCSAPVCHLLRLLRIKLTIETLCSHFHHHLTVRQDYREVLLGLCQDGLLGFLWVSGFSITAIFCFTLITCLLPSTCQHLRTRCGGDEDEQEDDPFSPRSYRHSTAGHLGRLHFASLYSYGSETSLPPLAHAAPATAVPPSQHIQTGPFTTNPIYEDAPLLRQQSPPPSVSPTSEQFNLIKTLFVFLLLSSSP